MTAPRIGLHAGLLSVVIPAFNEAERVDRCLLETVDALERLGCRYEVILVDDGSHDDTLERAGVVADGLPRVRVMGHEVNLGKGSALIRGAYAALGDLVVFVDADLEVHPRQLETLYDTLLAHDADVVIGSKLHPQSSIAYPPVRRVWSLAYYAFVRVFFGLPVHDTQTGLKIYRREVLRRVAPRLLVKRFAHDLEALVNAHCLGYTIVEAPVTVTRERPYPRVGLRDAFLVALDTAAVWYRTYVTHYYSERGRTIDRLLADTPRFDIFEVDRLVAELG